MSATISFPCLAQGWAFSRGRFALILTTAIGAFADLTKTPSIHRDVARICADEFNEAWPDRYPPADGLPLQHLDFSDYPMEELEEASKALRLAAEAFRQGQVPKGIAYVHANGASIGESADEIASLLEQGIANSHATQSNGNR